MPKLLLPFEELLGDTRYLHEEQRAAMTVNAITRIDEPIVEKFALSRAERIEDERRRTDRCSSTYLDKDYSREQDNTELPWHLFPDTLAS